MWPNPLETADLVTLTEEILNGKLHFLWGRSKKKYRQDFCISEKKNIATTLKITRGSPVCIAVNENEVAIAIKKNEKYNL